MSAAPPAAQPSPDRAAAQPPDPDRAAAQPPDPPGSPPKRPASDGFRTATRRTDLLVLALALALAALVTGGLWGDPAGRAVTVNSGDQALFEWLLAYGAHALTHGANPLFTHLLNVPDGVNLAVNTSVTVYAVVFAPVTLLAGPSVTFLVILVGNLAGTAYAWYLFFSRPLRLPAAAAAVGGLFCGFAPQLVSHANAHLNWTAQWLVPLLLWRVLRLREPGRWLRNGLLLGAAVAVAFSIAAEALFFTALACGVFLAGWALARVNRGAARAALPTFLRGLSVTAGAAGVLLAYPLWLHFFGPQRYHGTGFDHRIHSENAAAYAAFPQRSLAGLAGLDTRLAPNPTEENSFFGLPLLLLAAACAVLLWRRAPAALGAGPAAARRATLRAVLLTGGVFAVLSLGPRLKVGDTVVNAVPLPYAFLGRLPVFDAALPARLALVLTPVLGLLLAWTLAGLVTGAGRGEPGSGQPPAGAGRAGAGRAGTGQAGAGRAGAARTGRPRRAAWLAAFAAALLPLLPIPLRTSAREPVPDFITSGAWRQHVSDGGVLVPVPPTSDLLPDGQRWQAHALAARQGRFAIPGGFFLGPGGPDGRGRIGPVPRPTAALLAEVARTGVVPPIGPAERAAAAADLRYWRAEAVVLPDRVHGAKWPVHVAAVRQATTALLGPPTRVADVWLWRP